MNNIIKEYGLINFLLQNDADIAPLEMPHLDSDNLASMNPSIWINPDGTAYVNIRVVNYNLWNMCGREYTSNDQPIAYISLAQNALITNNYFGTFDINTLEIQHMTKVKMLPYEPKWFFIGLEDARIIKWDDKIHLCGVRRDLDENGSGRMELTQIEYINNEWTEVKRTRIPAAGDDNAYLEKNWMPIVDKPYTWLKWCEPIEIAHFDLNTSTLDIEFKNNTGEWYRGDSHVVHINDKYYCFVHLAETKQLRASTNARVSTYEHFVLEFDEDMNLIRQSPPFKYSPLMNIEFGCGLAYYDGFCYLTYAENDAASYIIKFNANLLQEIL